MDVLALPLGLVGVLATPLAVGLVIYRLLRRVTRAVRHLDEPVDDSIAVTTITFRGSSHAIGAAHQFDRAA